LRTALGSSIIGSMNEPRSELLDRHLRKQLQPQLDRVAGLMDRSVNYGTHLILNCDREAQQKHVLAAVMLGLHAVEALDSIAALIRNCCVHPAKILLRNQMEAMVEIKYMAQAFDLEELTASLKRCPDTNPISAQGLLRAASPVHPPDFPARC